MKRILTLLIVMLLIFCGCGKSGQPEETPSPVAPSITDSGLLLNPTPDPTPTPTPEPTPLPYQNPLNGEGLETDPGNYRPYAVMINNIVYAMPQCGVSQADIIYEVLAEGGVTRMIAIFSDITKAEKLGSMRSIRPYYIEIALSYDAIVVHAGGSDQAYSDIITKKTSTILTACGGAYGGSIFYRDPNRMSYGIEHSLFTTPEKILEYLPELGISEEHDGTFDYGLIFGDDAVPAGGESAESIDVDFGGQKMTYLTYNSDTEKYTAVQHSVDYIDGNTGEKVAFDNVLILYAETHVLDNYGRRSINLNGSGNGQFACGGHYIDIIWNHDGTGSPFTYTKADGTELALNVGKTYIAIVPTGSDIIFE